MAFSVTGALYVKYGGSAASGGTGTDGSQLVMTEWSGTAGASIDDLRVGRRGSGFDINTDTFGVSYKLRDGNTAGSGFAAGLFNTVGTFRATTPGYIQITGIKLGTVSADIGGAWWTAGLNTTQVDTNLGVGSTNINLAQNYGFNQFAFNLDFNVPVTEKISFQAYPWDKIQFMFNTGSATKSLSGTNIATNAGTTGLVDLMLPLHLDIGMDPISIGIFPKFHYKNVVDTWNTLAATNSQNSSQVEVGAMVRLGYKIDNVWGAYAHVGLYNDSESLVGITGTVTNTTTTGKLQAPIYVGLSFAPAGWMHMNLGIGYSAHLSDSTLTTSATGSSVTTNVNSSTGGGFQNIYSFFDEHGYVIPFMQFNGSAKFATDWELGLNTLVLMNGNNGTGEGGSPAVSSTSATGNTQNTGMFSWTPLFNWDNGNAYIKYTKDAVSFTGKLGNGGQLAGLFAWIDMSISY
jgi:hypothetical protein